MFDCPCDKCANSKKPQRLYVAFIPPIDPEGRLAETGYHAPQPAWTRTGDTIQNITLSPSIDLSKSGHWHGFITDGKVVDT